MSLNTSLFLLSTLFIFATCQTTVTPCVDDPTTDCWDYVALCHNPMYQNFLDVFCPKTCGFCRDSPTAVIPTADPNCKDQSPKCKSWVANGYCTSCFVDCQEKIANCAKSCGYCVSASCHNCKNNGKMLRFMTFE